MSTHSLIDAVRNRGILPLAACTATLAGYISAAPFNSNHSTSLLFLCKIAAAINIIAALIWVFRRDTPLAMFSAAGWLAATVYFAGIGPTAATLLLALASLAAGSVLLGATKLPASLVVACGLALLITPVSWTLPLPIHKNSLYFLVAAVLVVWQLRSIRTLLTSSIQYWDKTIRSMPWSSMLTINVLGICATTLWLPTMQSDDIAYHLALPSQLQALGYYRMAIDESIWALAPWASDVVHGISQVVAQAESRGAVNTLWLLILYAASWQLGRQFSLPAPLLAGIFALYASLPLSSAMLAGMQTELPSSALFVVLLALINLPHPLHGRQLCAIAAVAGLMLACKLSNALMLLPAAVWLVARHYPAAPIRWLPLACLLGAVVALPSYTYGLIIAGNPTLPFLNGYFESPYAPPGNWTDTSWVRPITPLLPWELSFNTSSYLNAPVGAGGFLYPLIFIALFPALYYRNTRALALVGISAFMLVFSQIQYVRYTHPAIMPLLLASFAGLRQMGTPARAMAATIIPLVMLNLSMINSGYWQLSSNALRSTVKQGYDATLKRYAPQRSIAQFLRELDTPPAAVLFHHVDSQGNAELVFPTSTTSWYNPSLEKQVSKANDDESGDAWKQLLIDRGISHLVVDRNKISISLKNALEGDRSSVVHQQGIYDVWQLNLRQQLEYEVVHEGTDYLKLHYHQKIDDISVRVVAQFQCAQPGNPIVISVSSRSDDTMKDIHHHSDWAMCDQDNIARGRLEVSLPEGPRQMHFTAIPRDAMDFKLISINTEISPTTENNATDPATHLRLKLFPGAFQDDAQ